MKRFTEAAKINRRLLPVKSTYFFFLAGNSYVLIILANLDIKWIGNFTRLLHRCSIRLVIRLSGYTRENCVMLHSPSCVCVIIEIETNRQVKINVFKYNMYHGINGSINIKYFELELHIIHIIFIQLSLL